MVTLEQLAEPLVLLAHPVHQRRSRCTIASPNSPVRNTSSVPGSGICGRLITTSDSAKPLMTSRCGEDRQLKLENSNDPVLQA